MQDDNKNEEVGSQKNTSKDDQASLDCVKQLPEQPAPEQVPASKEAALEGEKEDRVTSQAGNRRYCFRF